MDSQLPNGGLPPENFGARIAIDTPEQTTVEFAVAGIGSRFLALALDSLFQTVGITVLILAAAFLVPRFARGSQAGVWIAAAGILFFFLIFYGYYVIFEAVWSGQTPGKRIVRIRVIKDDGRPIGTIDSVLRNLMRIVDQLPFFYAVGIASALLNSKSKRLGDLVAGTIVVHERALQDIKPIWQAPAPEIGLRLGAERLTAEDLTIIEAFLNRREALESYIRHETAAKIAGRMRPKLTLPEEKTLRDEDLLEAIAAERRSSARYG